MRTSGTYLSISVFVFSILVLGCGNAPTPLDMVAGDDKTESDVTVSISSPSEGTWVNASNYHAFTFSGTCSAENKDVVISGSVSQTVTCSGGAWSAALDFTSISDGTDVISLTVTHSSAGKSATPAARTFSKDIVAPSVANITTPASSPHMTVEKTLTLSGSCTDSHIVVLSGHGSGSQICSSSAFSFNLSQAVDGTYNYQVKQIDSAGNSSSLSNFQWIINSSMPPTPVLTSPSVSPVINNLDNISIAGSCVTGYTVTLAGDASDSALCASSTFSFNVNKTSDANYNFSVYQTNTMLVNSASVAVNWQRDTVAPAAVTVVTPPTNPYTSGGTLTLSGSCESSATVYLSGDDSQNVVCASNAYSFLINKAVDGTYNFNLMQTDSAGNSSSSVAQTWIRNSGALPVPSVTSPATSTYTSNANSVAVVGTCVTGYTVSIASGAIVSEVSGGSLSQYCSSGAYNFTISKSVDGNHDFTFIQTDGFSQSPAASLTWIRDTVAPDSSILTYPTDPNLNLTANFTFNSNDPAATYQCQLDSTGWSTCSSPVTLSSITNGMRTYYVRAIDGAGNVETTPAEFSWDQQGYNTVALFHFDSGSDFNDSGLLSAPENNPLTNTGSTSATGTFSQGRQLASASSQFLTATDNSSLDLLNTTMTMEMQVKFTSLLTTNNTYRMLISKTGASGNMGWEIGYKRISSTAYRIAFRGSLDGVTLTERLSTNCTNDTTSFHHIAVTWNKGSIQFFCDGVAKGTGSIGTVGSAVLFDSTANLRIGRTETVSTTYQYLNGVIDEVRLSQIVRWTSGFSVPTSAYLPD